MAEVQLPVLSEPDATFLAAARRRLTHDFVKKPLASARRDFVSEKEPEKQSDSVDVPITWINPSAFPELPPITGFEEQSFDQDMTMIDVLADPAMAEETQVSKVKDDDDWHEEDLKNFESKKQWFESLKNPTMAQKVEFEAAKRKLDIQMKSYKIRRDQREQEQAEEEAERAAQQQLEASSAANQLFVPEEEQAVLSLIHYQPGANDTQPAAVEGNQPGSPAPTKIPTKRKRANRLSAAEKKKSMEVGFEPIEERLQAKKGQKSAVNPPKADGKKNAVGSGAGKKEGRRKKSVPNAPLNLSTNVVEEAHASFEVPALEGFTATKRKEAMTQMILSIPSADQEGAKDDAILLLNSLRKFNNRVRSDGDGCWKIKGLKTGIYNYQVIGCAFMRDRENSPDEPRGGILADIMGFGKTLQALVNIMDGAPLDPDDPVRTTLLIVPSHLIQHWTDQILEHCELETIGRVVNYHAAAKLATLNDIEDLQSYSVVITTYEEVRRSYPAFKPPKELANEDTLREQWKQVFEDKRGPLHHIKFHRIIADEAHAIKNWKTSVSIAVRALTARHKWLLSGTPVTNWSDEFYPLLSFLSVPGAGKYRDFLSYYRCGETGNERLHNLLRAYMLRRTHASRFMARPIISLPDIKEIKHEVEFSEAEWLIYNAIKFMFIESINEMASEPSFKAAQCRCTLTMILRLRMFCSHPLAVQHTLKYLLRPEGTLMSDISNISRGQGARSNDASFQIVAALMAAKNDYTGLIKQDRKNTPDQMGDNDIFTGNRALITNFRELMDSTDWKERYDRTMCPGCGQYPDKPVVTSCLHLYCEECFCSLHVAVEETVAEVQTAEKSINSKPKCQKCNITAEEATRFADPESLPEIFTNPTTQAEKRQVVTRGKGKSKKNGKPEAKEVDGEEDKDWIRTCGAKMPGAKLTGIMNIVKGWKQTSEDTKIVIFTQFTDVLDILAGMCEDEGWGYRCLSGKTRIPLRHKNLEDFEKDPEITVLIVSLRTGGTGLDMTVAHKCILVDLWWNEAVENQAFCRLLRHGQTKNVECVKMVVKDTIEDYMLNLQIKKTEDITSTMGDEILKERDTIVDILKLFADVNEDGSGRLHVKPSQKRERQGKVKDALAVKGKGKRGKKQ